MKTTLDIVAAWTALDVVLIAAWHAAHVRSRLGAGVAARRPATARLRDTQPALVSSARG
jgi:hypothetical protein